MEVFDPNDHQQPAPALVQRLRGLPLGGVLALSDGTLVKSVAMNQGPGQIRRFAVSRGGKTPFRAATAANTVPTAAEAAKMALKRGGSRD